MTKRLHDLILYVAAGFAVLCFPALILHFADDFYRGLARLVCLVGVIGCASLATIWFMTRTV
jgi:uncharacterized membrane protein YqjE